MYAQYGCEHGKKIETIFRQNIIWILHNKRNSRGLPPHTINFIDTFVSFAFSFQLLFYGKLFSVKKINNSERFPAFYTAAVCRSRSFMPNGKKSIIFSRRFRRTSSDTTITGSEILSCGKRVFSVKNFFFFTKNKTKSLYTRTVKVRGNSKLRNVSRRRDYDDPTDLTCFARSRFVPLPLSEVLNDNIYIVNMSPEFTRNRIFPEPVRPSLISEQTHEQ